MRTSSVKVVNNMPKFYRSNTEMMGGALSRMGRDIVNISKIRVPFKDGDLMKSAEEVKVSVLHRKVLYNKEYAGYQERAKRKDGSRKVRNYSTPGTGKDFLKGAGKQVKQNVLNYFKQAASLAKA